MTFGIWFWLLPPFVAGLIICGCMYGTYRMGLKQGRLQREELEATQRKLEDAVIKLIRHTYNFSRTAPYKDIKAIRKEFSRIDEEIGKDMEQIKNDDD